MSVRFYIDVHVSGVITRTLQLRGIDVLTSQEDGTREFEDSELLDRANRIGKSAIYER
jgi:hypothetical protein